MAVQSHSAFAGGFDRGGVDINYLFDEAPHSLTTGVVRVMPQRELKDIKRGNSAVDAFAPGLVAPLETNSKKINGDYTLPYVYLKYDLYEDLSCLASYTRPFGGYADYGSNNAYSASAVNFKLKTEDYGLTCGVKFGLGETSLGESRLTFLGGASYLDVHGTQTRQSFLDFAPLGGVPNPYAALPGQPAYLLTNPYGTGEFDLKDTTWGWRAGVAYEIPDIALRAQVIYNSKYKLDGLSGYVDTTDFKGVFSGVYDVNADAEIPQSVEARMQSGINETTLLFGSVKWQEWSKLQSIAINGVINPASGADRPTSFDLYYRDGWTVTAGVGKKITEQFSGQLALTWDRGTSTINGFQSDSWLLSGGISNKLNEQTELVFGGVVGVMEGGRSLVPKDGDSANNVTYNFDADMVYALTAKLKIKF